MIIRALYCQMPNILLISYPFPPSGTVGVSRAMAYVRYLRIYGCHVSVLTATMPETSGYDSQLCELIPKDVPVYRAWNPELPFALRDRIWKRLTSAPQNNRDASHTFSQSTGYKRSRMVQKIRSLAQYALFPD